MITIVSLDNIVTNSLTPTDLPVRVQDVLSSRFNQSSLLMSLGTESVPRVGWGPIRSYGNDARTNTLGVGYLRVNGRAPLRSYGDYVRSQTTAVPPTTVPIKIMLFYVPELTKYSRWSTSAMSAKQVVLNANIKLWEGNYTEQITSGGSSTSTKAQFWF